MKRWTIGIELGTVEAKDLEEALALFKIEHKDDLIGVPESALTLMKHERVDK